jgi:hypothetical protein
MEIVQHEINGTLFAFPTYIYNGLFSNMIIMPSGDNDSEVNVMDWGKFVIKDHTLSELVGLVENASPLFLTLLFKAGLSRKYINKTADKIAKDQYEYRRNRQ